MVVSVLTKKVYESSVYKAHCIKSDERSLKYIMTFKRRVKNFEDFTLNTNNYK